jgi:uncharacterized membrane protein YkoI
MALLSMQGHADDQDHALQLREAGKILSLEEILSISRKQIEGRVLEVELERKHGTLIYELEILDDKGRVWELKVDATDGRIIKREQE